MTSKKLKAKELQARERSEENIAKLVSLGYAPESALKQRSVVFRVSLDEFEQFTAAADADGRTLSNWLRKVASDASKRR